MTPLRTTPALGEQRSRFIRSADDSGLLAQRITHTIAHTIAHPWKVWWRKDHHFYFLICLLFQELSRSFRKSEDRFLILSNCRVKCLAMPLRCFQRWVSSGFGKFLDVESSLLMNFVGSCTGFSLFKAIKANPFKSLMSSNFVPLIVLTISCEFTPFTLA